jgi:hypothetical protein
MDHGEISLPTHQTPHRSYVFIEQGLALSIHFTICRGKYLPNWMAYRCHFIFPIVTWPFFSLSRTVRDHYLQWLYRQIARCAANVSLQITSRDIISRRIWDRERDGRSVAIRHGSWRIFDHEMRGSNSESREKRRTIVWLSEFGIEGYFAKLRGDHLILADSMARYQFRLKSQNRRELNRHGRISTSNSR